MTPRPPVVHICRHRVDQMIPQGELAQYGLARGELVERIADVISRNLVSGRAQRAMVWSEGAVEEPEGPEGAEEDTSVPPRPDAEWERSAVGGPLEVYIDRVMACYLQEHGRVERLAAGDESAWNELGKQLAGRAYNFLRRRQVPDDRAADDAHDFAQQACEIVYREPFPYDVSFDAWTTLILHNCIRQRDSRSRDLIDRDRRVISLDLPDPRVEWNDFSLYDVLSDVSGLTPFERLEVQEWLLQAIGRLRSRVQQQVIINTYFDELSDEDIAQRLGKSKNNVQLLRHRALKRLKQILEKK